MIKIHSCKILARASAQIQSRKHEIRPYSFSAMAILTHFANKTDSGVSARQGLSHLKSALFASQISKYYETRIDGICSRPNLNKKYCILWNYTLK